MLKAKKDNGALKHSEMAEDGRCVLMICMPGSSDRLSMSFITQVSSDQ